MAITVPKGHQSISIVSTNANELTFLYLNRHTNNVCKHILIKLNGHKVLRAKKNAKALLHATLAKKHGYFKPEYFNIDLFHIVIF